MINILEDGVLAYECHRLTTIFLQRNSQSYKMESKPAVQTAF